MKKSLVLFIYLILSLSFVANAQIPIYDMNQIDDAKSAYLNGDEAMLRIVQSFMQQAEGFLAMEDPSVTDKNILPPSQDPRDYMSLAPYWWPNPDTPDGLPYIRRDGERNPEYDNYLEVKNASLVTRSSQILGLLYYFTGEDKYAQKCASIIRTWFLDPVKGMNPNLNYAQAIKGINVGRDAGIISANEMLKSFAAAYFIKDSKYWTSQDQKELSDWARAFWYWLGHSKNGIKECSAKNNHGLWYEVCRLYTMSQFATADEILESLKTNLLPRIEVQMEPDGKLPAELVRTNALGYTTYALNALISADRMCRNLGCSIWDYVSESGKRLATAVEFVSPYYEHPETWEYQQIGPFHSRQGAMVLYEAGLGNNRQDWLEKAREIGYSEPKSDINSVFCYKIYK